MNQVLWLQVVGVILAEGGKSVLHNRTEQVYGYMYGCVEPFVLSRSPYGMHSSPPLSTLFIVTDHERVLDLLSGCAKMTLMMAIFWLFGKSVLYIEELQSPTTRDLDFFKLSHLPLPLLRY